MKSQDNDNTLAAYARRLGYPVQADGSFIFVDGKGYSRETEEMLQLLRRAKTDPLRLTAPPVLDAK